MNQSSHPEVGMVSLLYTIALRSNRRYLQSFKSYYTSTCFRHDGKFLLTCRHEKDLDDSPTACQEAFESDQQIWHKLRSVVERELEKAKTNYHTERIWVWNMEL